MSISFHRLSRKWWAGLILIIGLIGLSLGAGYYLNLWLRSVPGLQSSHSTSLALSPSLQPQPLSAELSTSSPATKVLFTGDIMFDRNIRAAAQKHGNDFIFAPIRELLLAQDFVVANLEGPVTSSTSRSLGSVVGSPANYSFTFDPSVAETLYRHNIKIVNLGNNHIFNFGQAGLDQTLAELAKARVTAFGYTGAAATSSPLAYSHVIEHNHQKIALVNYNQFSPGSDEVALAEIARLRPQADWVVVYTHWDNEYQPVAADSTVQLAHQFIDTGADLIIGSHPHVIQNHEVYKDKHIYYSLGNFVFDQYFEPAVRKGLLVEATFELNPKQIRVKEVSIFLNTNGQTSLSPK